MMTYKGYKGLVVYDDAKLFHGTDPDWIPAFARTTLFCDN